MTRVTVVGAGNGGLTTAAILARAGFDVTVLEAHSYPGGCAGTFRRKQYRFDAGATLAGGFNRGEVMDIVASEVGISKWRARYDTPAMVVHLPNNDSIPRYGGYQRWKIRQNYFGVESQSFWKWQERTADALWDFANRSPPFPPQDRMELADLIRTSVYWLGENLTSSIRPSMIKDAFTPLGPRLRSQSELLRRFIDGQLLISSQTISRYANALFAASALDLPRRGIVHFEGGIGTIARQLEQAIVENGGEIKYKQRVSYIQEQKNNVYIRTNKGLEYTSDLLVTNITPWDLKDLIPRPNQPHVLTRLPKKPKGGWGAFMIYLGIDKKYIPDGTTLHHQILSDGKMTEGNSIFLSISPLWDDSRAPPGKRAITISTHTTFSKWWQLHHKDIEQYSQLKQKYVKHMLKQAKRLFPDIEKADLIESGTPLTFNHFTNRKFGWVGGFRQENLFKTFGPRLSKRIWMVGDSIFPGQSTAAVSLGGLRVARSILNQTS